MRTIGKMTATVTATPETKLKELILYVARRCELHEFFGTIKLNKILLYSDWNAYLQRGRGVTGVPYVKDQFGPVPQGIKTLVKKMESDKDAIVLTRVMPGDQKVQHRVVATREPNLDIFDPADVATVDEIIDWIRPMTARRISNLTHRCVGWKSAKYDDVIPYSAALIPDSPIPLTPTELDVGVALGKKIAGRTLHAG